VLARIGPRPPHAASGCARWCDSAPASCALHYAESRPLLLTLSRLDSSVLCGRALGDQRRAFERTT